MAIIFVRTPSLDVKMDVLQSLSGSESNYICVDAIQPQPDILIADIDDGDRETISAVGGIVYDDIQFQSFGLTISNAGAAIDPYQATRASLSLDDVAAQIQCPAAWRINRGQGATIVIVDSGISPGLRELSMSRRSPYDLPTTFQGQHWQDPDGHGSMCAAIAAGSKAGGGRFDGVAPAAHVVSARSDLTTRDLTLIFDQLVQARSQAKLPGPLIISNSYGLRCCRSIGKLPSDHPFLTGIQAAVASGIFVCFAAGNNHHDLCNYDPLACQPNTIWGANSLDEVVCVGTVNRDLTNQDRRTPHVNSSRGPGEYANRTTKPDCVAPTYGEVPWGHDYRNEAWWGTSGGCPQIAGLAALILSVAPHLDPGRVAHIIRTTSRPLSAHPHCVGHGLIDCGAAVSAAQAA